MREIVLRQFQQMAGRPPAGLVRAPGRVNLIGEHTDYNDGFVLPIAIERAVWIAFAPADDAAVTLVSHTFDETRAFDLRTVTKDPEGSWIEYAKGVAAALAEAGLPLRGWRGVVASDVPVGSGLSSSAALEVALAHVFAAVGGYELTPAQAARVGQRAENAWVGVQCGIMDQLASAAGAADRALLIDCRSLDVRPVPMPADCAVVVMDTGTRRRLQQSAYNERRVQCEAGARFFGVAALRDLSPEDFAARADELEEITRRRCRHVVSENARVLRAAASLEAGDAEVDGAEAFGRLMVESHASLRDDFAVSSPALDAMVEAALAQPGCLGARMTGAGFGGCAVALVDADRTDAFIAATADRYRRQTDETPALFATRATPGAGMVR